MNPSCEIVAPVFQEYRNILARFIQSRVKDPVDSEELLSEVMLKIYNHCEKLVNVRNTEAWLITIARNTITDYFREKQKKRFTELSVDPPSAGDETDLLLQQLEECVPSLIDKLPRKYAGPLADYELHGISQKSLASKYDLSESGLKSRVQRGRRMLKDLFSEYCSHLIDEERVVCRNCDCES